MSSIEVVLNWPSAQLYKSDLEILRSPDSWLNDQLLTFYFEYLSRELKNNWYLFVAAQTSFFINTLMVS